MAGHSPSSSSSSGFQFTPPGPAPGPGAPSDSRAGLRHSATHIPMEGPSPKDILSASVESDDEAEMNRLEQPDQAGHQVREQRMPCSFPGALKVLIPEKSFVPTTLAVRVANLSASGAMVEVHDRSKIDRDIAMANRFFELRIAHPELPLLRGVVAWSDTNRSNPLMGLSCFERIPTLEEIVLQAEGTGGMQAPPPLPPPKLEPIPPIAEHPTVRLHGEAHEALEVIVRGDKDKFTGKVEHGKFEVIIELDKEGDNHFSLRSYAGQRKSRAIPIRINYEPAGKPREAKRFEVDLKKDGKHQLVHLEFNGDVRQAERVLYRFSQLMSMSERVSLVANLQTGGKFDERLLSALKGEAAMFGDDTRNAAKAAKLLDELL